MEGKSWIQKWGTRHTFITLSFFLMIMNQCWRINLSVAIVAMVNHGEYVITFEYFTGSVISWYVLEKETNLN